MRFWASLFSACALCLVGLFFDRRESRKSEIAARLCFVAAFIAFNIAAGVTDAIRVIADGLTTRIVMSVLGLGILVWAVWNKDAA